MGEVSGLSHSVFALEFDCLRGCGEGGEGSNRILILISNKTMKSFYYAAKCGVSGEAAGNVVPCYLHRRRRHGVKRRDKNIFNVFIEEQYEKRERQKPLLFFC